MRRFAMSMNNRKQRFLLFLSAVLLVSSTVYAGGKSAPVGATGSEVRNRVFATVERVESNTIFFKAEDGTVRDFGVKEAKRDGLRKVRPGAWVALEINDQNNIAHLNRAAVGTVKGIDREKRRIVVQAGPGKPKTYILEDAALGKLVDAREGARVTLELDRRNRVMDAELA
jgi:hypothetical protein